MTGKKLPTEGVYLKDFPDYIKQHAGDCVQLKELKLFSGRSIRQLRKKTFKKQKEQIRKGRQIIKKREFFKIKGHRIFDRGSGLMIIRFSTDFCKRKRHVCVLNLNSSYIYDGGDKFLPFRKDMVSEENQKIALLKYFGVKAITEVYLVTSSTTFKGNGMSDIVTQGLYGGIDISKNEITTQISRHNFVSK